MADEFGEEGGVSRMSPEKSTQLNRTLAECRPSESVGITLDRHARDDTSFRKVTFPFSHVPRYIHRASRYGRVR